jgi:hypothetical protein
MNPEREFKAAALACARRLQLFKRTQLDAQERGDAWINLRCEEFWEAEDEKVLEEFNQAMNRLTGSVPLPMEFS